MNSRWLVSLNDGSQVWFDTYTAAQSYRYSIKEIPSMISAHSDLTKAECVRDIVLYSPESLPEVYRLLEEAKIVIAQSHVRTIRAKMISEGLVKRIMKPASKRSQPKALRFAEKKPVRTAVKTMVENVSMDDLQAAAGLVSKLGSAGAAIAAIQMIAKLQGKK